MKTIETQQSKEKSFAENRQKMIVEYGMTYIHGNSQPYFSITAGIWRVVGTRLEEDSFGCLHDEIRRHFPELARLIPFHLSNQNDGLPMHYKANAKYWREQNKWQTLCKHLRVELNESNLEMLENMNSADFLEYLEERKELMRLEFESAMRAFNVEYIVI